MFLVFARSQGHSAHLTGGIYPFNSPIDALAAARELPEKNVVIRIFDVIIVEVAIGEKCDFISYPYTLEKVIKYRIYPGQSTWQQEFSNGFDRSIPSDLQDLPILALRG